MADGVEGGIEGGEGERSVAAAGGGWWGEGEVEGLGVEEELGAGASSHGV